MDVQVMTRDDLSFTDMRPEEKMIIRALERAFIAGQHEMRIAELQIANGWDEVEEHECPEGHCETCAEALRRGNSKVRNNLRRLVKYGWIRRPVDGTYALTVEPKVHPQLVHIRKREAIPNPRELTKDECRNLRARVMAGDYKPLDAIKRPDCSFYNACIDQALSGNWAGFSCTACTAYTPTPDFAQKWSDVLALRAMDKAAEQVWEFGKVLRVRGVKPGADAKRSSRDQEDEEDESDDEMAACG